ncbi:hypothetical protein [Tropicibacter sp. S64]|uniref:hypothetical protein n=1 Tax=Tropicibacter sp. S64 TaxID=3415122 RepID=UPI003C7A7723
MHTKTFSLLSGLFGVVLLSPVQARVTNLIGDHSIPGRLCTGLACTSAEGFAPDVDLKIKDGRPVLMFDDSSTQDRVPDRDWILEANDTEKFGDEYFALRDGDTDNQVFRVFGDAPANSLVVSSSGNIGIGTGLPAANLHIEDDCYTGIKLHRNDSGGRPNSDLIIEASTSALLINDRTLGGSSPVLQFATGMPPASVVVDSQGELGLGTVADVPLHVWREDGTAAIKVENDPSSPPAAREMFRMENNGGSYFSLANTTTGNDWFFVHENNSQGSFFINHSDGGLQMALTRTGDMTLKGDLYTADSCAAGCDRVFDEGYPLPSIPEQMAAIRAKGHLPNVGPTDEDGPFDLSSMTTGMLNELEKAYLYIDRLNRDHETEISALQAEVAQLQSERDKLADILARLAALEAKAGD